jgi:hypothetical protein
MDESIAVIVGTVVIAVLSLASLAAGIFCITRYMRTRKRVLLVVGLLLTFVAPGILFCLVVALWAPAATVVYGPAPGPAP